MMKVIKCEGHVIRYGITDDEREMFFANVDYTEHDSDILKAAGVDDDFLEMCGKKRNGDMNYVEMNVLYAFGYYADGTPTEENAMPPKYARRILAISESDVVAMREKMKDMTAAERVEYINNLIPKLRKIWAEKAKAVIKKYDIK
jgi:hypothetical protein